MDESNATIRTNDLLKPAAVLLLCVLLAGCGGGQALRVARVGQPAPDWTEPLAPHGELSLASLKGKAVYLNFFATWCPPCNAEASSLNALQRQDGSKGLQIVGVDVLESAKKAEAFRAEHHVIYPTVVDAGLLREQYAVNGLPVHVFIDRQGVVRKIVVGELSAAQMRRDAAEILK
jgi:cytochrome c biogenesis protein CcmG/thiol:disulfide interchange protein DsbE